MREFVIFLKQSLFYWPLLALLIVMQLALGHLSSAALSEDIPELGIALVREGDGPLADRHESTLLGIEGLNVVIVPAGADREDVFLKHKVQGLAVIPSWFDEYMAEGRDKAVLFYPAPGVTDPSVAVEFLSTAALLLRADMITEAALADLGIGKGDLPGAGFEDRSTLVLEYEGPPMQESRYFAPPAFGVPALFLLMALLHAIQVVPGRDSRRLMRRGMKNRVRFCLAGLASQMVVWVCIVLVYGLCMLVLYKVPVPVTVLLTLIGIALYACSLGGVLSAAGLRTWGTWVFIIWILFNMTLGGGLWGSSVTNPLMIPLLPVSSVVSFTSADATAALTAVYAAFAVCLAVFCVILHRKKISE